MAEEWNPAVGGRNLLYPELLSREELVQILISVSLCYYSRIIGKLLSITLAATTICRSYIFFILFFQRCVQKQLLEGLDKYKLVDLFHRIVLPLPQRTYSDNRRGKILNALRKKAEM